MNSEDRQLIRNVLSLLRANCGAPDGMRWLSNITGITIEMLPRHFTRGIITARHHRAILAVMRGDAVLASRMKRSLSLAEWQKFEQLEIRLYGGAIDPSSYPCLGTPRSLADACTVVQYAMGALAHRGIDLSRGGSRWITAKRHAGYVTSSMYHQLMSAIRADGTGIRRNIIDGATSRGGGSAHLGARLREAAPFFAPGERAPKRSAVTHAARAVAKKARTAATSAPALAAPTASAIAPSGVPCTSYVTRETIVTAISAMMDDEIKRAMKDRDRQIADLQAQTVVLTQQRDEWEAIAAKLKGVLERIRDYIEKPQEIATLAGRIEPNAAATSDEAVVSTKTRRGRRSRPFRTPPLSRTVPGSASSLHRGKAPFGYRLTGASVVPHPRHFATLKHIVALHNAGRTMANIAKQLNEERRPTAADTLWTTKGLEAACARLRKRGLI